MTHDDDTEQALSWLSIELAALIAVFATLACAAPAVLG